MGGFTVRAGDCERSVSYFVREEASDYVETRPYVLDKIKSTALLANLLRTII